MALGYTMVYGIILLLNFTYGIYHWARTFHGLLWYSCSCAPIAALWQSAVCVVLGVAINKCLRAAQGGAAPVLITAIGVSYFLESGSQLLLALTRRWFRILSILRQ